MRKIQSFVRRSGRLTTSQRYALDNLIQNFVVTDFKNISAIFTNNNPIILEIGFGDGDSLVKMAQFEPEHNFIGVEMYEAGIGRIVNNINNLGLQNLKIIQDDAMLVLQQIPNNTLSGLQLYFPDPWHKKRHNKRRIVNQYFLSILAQKIKKNGFVHITTDWQEYSQQILNELNGNNHFENTTHGFAEKPDRRPITKFEKRGLKLGHGVWDLLFIVV